MLRRGTGGAIARLHPNVRIGTVGGRGRRLQEGSRRKGSLKGKRGLKGGQLESRLKTKAITWGALCLWSHKLGAVQRVRLKMCSSITGESTWRDGVGLVAKLSGASRSEGGELQQPCCCCAPSLPQKSQKSSNTLWFTQFSSPIKCLKGHKSRGLLKQDHLR